MLGYVLGYMLGHRLGPMLGLLLGLHARTGRHASTHARWRRAPGGPSMEFLARRSWHGGPNMSPSMES